MLQTVSGMSAEQKQTLLFFWTSVKYLPVEGFRGLASRLYIYKSEDSSDRLPSSHTCFYRLCLPTYPTLSVMRDRLHLITQEHVSCSFGTWWRNSKEHLRFAERAFLKYIWNELKIVQIRCSFICFIMIYGKDLHPHTKPQHHHPPSPPPPPPSPSPPSSPSPPTPPLPLMPTN